MKKTISINLQGIIFHVEEDGYALLHSYLQSVKAYFSSFEGHEEIMADIESRMAEIFLTRLNPGKQIISLEDVQYLVGRMGSVQDFAAQNADLDEEPAYSNKQSYSSAGNTAAGAATTTRKLYRDESRRMVAGVAAGIANYLSVDPLWIRLFFILTIIGLPFTGGGSAFGLVLYAILWAILPVSHSLPDRTVKKLYRDPEDKKLGGVSAGIGAYFGVDPIWIRLAFLVSVFFFGTGLLAYIILWIVMPEAKTPSEKAEMHGNPVTLSSIEQAVRSNQTFKDERGQENLLARIILLPVQLLSRLIELIGPAVKAIFKFLLTFIRIVAGIMLIIFGLSLMAGAIFLLLAAFELVSEEQRIVLADIPVQLFSSDFSWYGLVAGFLSTLIPGIVVLIVGLSLLAKRSLMRASVGWTLFGLWLVAVMVLGVSAALFATNFKRTAMFSEQAKYSFPASGTLVLAGKEYPNGGEFTQFEDLDLTIEPGPDSANLVLLKQYTGKGRTEDQATQAARMLEVPVTQTDSMLTFSTSQLFKKGTKFRDQDLTLRLLVPEGKPFVLNQNLADYVSFSPAVEGVSTHKLYGKTLQFSNGKLTCLSCTAADSADEEAIPAMMDIPAGASTRVFDLEKFDEVNASGFLKVTIVPGHNYRVTAYGKQHQLNDLDIAVDNEGELDIELDQSIWKKGSYDPILLRIETPEVNRVNLAGAVEGKVEGFSTGNLDVVAVGASSIDVSGNLDRLDLNLVGASSATASGTVDYLVAELLGASELKATRLMARRAEVKAIGASSARINVIERLEAETSGASSIRYSGNPNQVEKNESGAGTVKPE